MVSATIGAKLLTIQVHHGLSHIVQFEPFDLDLLSIFYLTYLPYIPTTGPLLN